MHIDQLNIHNLTSLWIKYGATTVIQQDNSKLLATPSWPYRCWVEGKQNLTLQLSQTPETHKLCSWPYPASEANDTDHPTSLNKHWHLEIEQTAMYLPLENISLPTRQQSAFSLHRVEDLESLTQWLDVSAEAFGYEMDIDVFKPLLTDQSIEIYLGKLDQQPAVSALLFKTGHVIGLHQMGVKQDFQGKGLAKTAMLQLLSRAQQQEADYMVLQASRSGLPLYLSLGFHKQFKLLNFQFIDGASDTQYRD